MKRTGTILLITSVMAALAWALISRPVENHDKEFAVPSTTSGVELIGGGFTLTDHTGRQVSDTDYRGKYMIVFFGFTHCPEVCPLGLHTIVQALTRLGAEADKVTPIFITVDPERDDVTRLASFVKSYDSRLIGLTGRSDAIKKVAKAYRAYYRKINVTASGNYNMDHSAVIYFMDPGGRYVTHFASELGAEEIAHRIQEILQ